MRIGPEHLSDVRGEVQRSLEASLDRLGRDSVDVLYLHSHVSMERGGTGERESLGIQDVLGAGGVADAFDAMRSQGLIRFPGFTAAGEIGALHQMIDSGRFDVLQAYYNLLNPSAGIAVPAGFAAQDFERLIDRAAERDVGVVVIRVLAGGALAGPVARTGYASPSVGGVMVPGGEYDADEARAQALDFLVAGDVTSRPQAEVCFALAHTGVSTVLVGYSSLAQMEAAAACSGKGPLPDAAMQRLQGLWANDFGRG